MTALLRTVALIILLMTLPSNGISETSALLNYLSLDTGPTTYTLQGTEREKSSTAYRLSLRSQTWRGIVWNHDLRLIVPDKVDHPHHLLLQIAGSGGSDAAKAPHLTPLAEAAGMVTAILMDVPNQPLFGDKTEDELIAYTFDKFAESGDITWPLLFPMVKSVNQTMTQLQEFLRRELGREITSFVITGASKRGWTTYLVGASDKRVVGIAPMVFDMLDMKAQTNWAKKMYGEQSEKLQDYTRLNLIARIDEPRMKELRGWVDPINYLELLTMPKLVLLGTNDPYWVVDSLRHYYPRFKGPSNVYLQPNGTHSAGTSPSSLRTLASWARLVAGKKTIPQGGWDKGEKRGDKEELSTTWSITPQSISFYQSFSLDRDFRNDEWKRLPSSNSPSIKITHPDKGHLAVMGEATFIVEGRELVVSTPPRVFP